MSNDGGKETERLSQSAARGAGDQGRERFIAGELSLFDRHAVIQEDGGNFAVGGEGGTGRKL
jgi:hypothetical protein